jgi:hypothetical protein
MNRAAFASLSIFCVIVSAFIAFTLGTFTAQRSAATTQAPAASLARSRLLGALSAENERLKAEVHLMNAALDDLKADNAKLAAESPEPAPPPARADGLIGEPLPRHEIQRSILNNLRTVMAAKDQFQLEYGRAPSSIDEIVGAQAYVKRLVPVDGEDYTSLSMQRDTLAIVTASGVTVKYGDGTGPDATTTVEYPPELAAWRAKEASVNPSATAALEAYRLANRGKDPTEDRALVPFFATPQQAADFLEFLEMKP